jgi:Secretion system C-terminal sorting domain
MGAPLAFCGRTPISNLTYSKKWLVFSLSPTDLCTSYYSQHKKCNMVKTIRLIGTLCCGLLVQQLSAQTLCPFPQSSANLEINNIKARISNSGDLFTDGQDAKYTYTPAGGVGSIYAASLWMGGIDPAGNINLAAMSYRVANKTEYAAGPLNATTGTIDASTCANWDRMFGTTKIRIDSFLGNLPAFVANPQSAIDQFPDIMGWPAIGNPHFSGIYGFTLPDNQGLASFVDTNSDGIYNPLSGDFPAVILQGKAPFVPDQILWCVFNDAGTAHLLSGGSPIGMEIQLTSWAFDTPSGVPFSNTVFTSYKTIYRGFYVLSDFHIGVWTDFDLGCYLDDYIGCAPASNTFFAYNQDPEDGQPGSTCNGTPTFGTETPVQTATFLNTSMDKFIAFNSPNFGSPSPATTDPTSPIEYYNFLTGRWRDGLPLTAGDNGYNPSSSSTTNFIFPDNPADLEGWSMCMANLPFGDRRTVASHKIGDLEPGAISELTMSWTLHPNIPGPCNLGNALQEVTEIQNAYDNSFDGVSGVFSPVTILSVPVKVLPNPAHDAVTLDYGQLNVAAIRCFDMRGGLIFSQNNPNAGMQSINTAAWPTGNYAVQLVTNSGIVPVRIAVMR